MEGLEKAKSGVLAADSLRARPGIMAPQIEMREKGSLVPEVGPRKVCDHCRRRRIRCDGGFPCDQCTTASLPCKRDHIPKRRGPKKGTGRIINQLRAQGPADGRTKSKAQDSDGGCSESIKATSGRGSAGTERSPIEQLISNTQGAPAASSSESRFTGYNDTSRSINDGPDSIYGSNQFRPTTRSYLHLIPTCIDLYIEHIYPIMPLVHIPTLRATVTRDLTPSEKNFVYALCGLTSTHMLGKSIKAHGPEPWDAVGTFFLDECISNRQQYDFVEDRSLSAVISSYLISSAYFELNQSRKTWYYLREAVTMGQDLGLHDENSYVGLEPSEALCRRRTFWILYVTERSFAILRHKPLALSKTPALPTSIHEYESPDIHTGFMRLIQSFHLLNSSFVDTWNEASSAPQSTQTYTLLQADLSITPVTQSLTSTQKADILVTQQWLRLIVWQSSMRQGLLSNINEIESMTFSYPLKIAYSLLSIISSLPGKSIEVHGMGIFEKIFEIGNAMLDVVHACGNAALVRTGYSGTAIGLGRGGIWIDPFEVFIRTLSQNPNSQTQYANVLLAKASERPEIMRYSGGIAPPLGLSAPRYDDAPPSSTIDTSGETVNIQERQTQNQRGRIIGEITADDALWETFTDLDADKAQEGIQTEGASIDPQEILGLDVMWDPGVVAGYDINDDFLDDMNVWAR